MIDIRIVCTYDAVSFAETLMRLLSAEEHKVRLCYGRASLAELEHAKTERDAVLLIWSQEAPGQHYMWEWARGIAPERLVEIARAPGAPRIDKRAAPVEFASWRGERGSRAWNGLSERLRAVSRAMEPPKPAQLRAAMAMGLASAAAVTGAVLMRASEPDPTMMAAVAPASAEEPFEAMGGPLVAEEPASIDPPIAFRARAYRVAQVTLPAPPELEPIVDYQEPDLRDPTFIERLASLNPLRGD